MFKSFMILVFFMVSNLAFALNIYGEGSNFVKTSEVEDSVNFELCLKADETRCQAIGNRITYNRSDLEKLVKREKRDIVFASIADIGLIAVGAYAGFAVGLMSAAAIDTAAAASLLYVGPVAGVAGAIVLESVVTTLNPFEQYQQYKLLKTVLKEDGNFFVEDETFVIVGRLERILAKLD